MSKRTPIGYVVEMEGSKLLVNLLDTTRGLVAGHPDGISSMEQPGDLVGIEAGADIVVARISALSFAEPREVHQPRSKRGEETEEPLRQMQGFVIGYLNKREGVGLEFEPHDWRLPALGASVFPLSAEEHRATVSYSNISEHVTFGSEVRNPSVYVNVGINELLSRHVAILGSTGQGKTHFVASVLQKLAKLPRSRIVIFDVNGEYESAFSGFGNRVKKTVIGGQGENGFKIPYYALGRHGLFRLLMPSERTQSPALRFALEHLAQVECAGDNANVVGQAAKILRDDCLPGNADSAKQQIESLRTGTPPQAAEWPHMQAVACLAADSYALSYRSGHWVRDAFAFSHLQALINRIRTLVDDERFRAVVDVQGGRPAAHPLNIGEEARFLVDEIFGPSTFVDDGWNVHIVDVSKIAQDLMPFVLGSLLELLASEVFRRGPNNSYPTLLALEEAHHYLRQTVTDADSSETPLAYERLAKEGRKFGLSLLVSTQRPSEVSPTVLAQCGTWAVFRLNSEQDQRAVASAAEAAGPHITRQLPGLARGEALVFGNALPVATRVNVTRPSPEPTSDDPPFVDSWLPEILG